MTGLEQITGNAREVPKKRIAGSLLLALAFLGVYLTAIQRNFHEKSVRSLELKDDVPVADHVNVSITIIKADPTTRQLTARIRFRPVGGTARDAVTPSKDLRFLVNNSPGQQVFDLPKGKAVSRIEVTLPMEGDLNRYPFDRYESNIWLLMDTPEKAEQKQAPMVAPVIAPVTPFVAPSTATTEESLSGGADSADRPPDEIVMQGSRPVPISISLSASTPGMKYTGEVVRSNEINAIRIHLNLRRPGNLVNASIMVMCLMMGLALGVVAMVLKAMITRREKLEVVPLSLTVSLIFGLPALRNIQPGVPPVGVLGDYFSFIWAEVFVAAAAIIMALTWVFGTEHEPASKPSS